MRQIGGGLLTGKLGGMPIELNARALASAGVGGVWTPSRLFRSGEKGLALDLTDMSKLYQDIARTTLVTATGQPIGSASDISGNGVNATAAADNTTRPTYDGWATLDGSNDALITAAIDMTGTDAVTVIAGIRKLSDAAAGVPVEFGPNVGTTDSTFGMFAPPGANARYSFGSRGTVSARFAESTSIFAAPRTDVVTGIADISTDTCLLRVNGTQVASNTNDQGAVNYGNRPIYIGARGGTTVPFNGRMYRLIVIGRQLTANELSEAEAWVADPF